MQRCSLAIFLLVMGISSRQWSGAAPVEAAAATAPVSHALSQTDTTFRILALRVEFVADQVATTTGSGRFDYGAETTYALDRPPHNRTYFQHQLLGLGNYFARVSGGRVRLSADVFPTAESETYQLPHDMVYYSGQEDETRQQQRWAELLRDALQLAAAGGEIDFSHYAHLIVFHAGVGQDFAFDFDSTPYDIQSVYMDAASLASGLGQDPRTYQGIECPGGVRFRDGIILPETQNQESYDLGLLGTMTLLYGSQIGMPSLFDTGSGRAGIGAWGLMDQGSYNFQGFIPAEPSAWEKIYMGWEEPVVVQNSAGVRIGTSRTQSAPHIIKVPVTASEYFLIENRQRDNNRDKMTIGRDENGKKAEFDSTGRVVAATGIGVLTRIDEYDYALPGSGLLIWHIDEKVIADHLASNAINNNPDHRGVDLVECDGAQDIGYLYDLFDAGYGTENGDWWDPWWSGNSSWLYVNDTYDELLLSASTIPSSNGHNGAVTGIRFENFSDLDSVMTLTISSGFIAPGFPRREAVGKKLDAASLSAYSGRNGEEGVIIAATADGQLYAWRSEGSALFASGSHRVASPLTAAASAPLFADLDGDGVQNLIYPATNGALFYYDLAADLEAPGLLRLWGIYPLGDSLGMQLALAGGASTRLILGNSRGRISIIRYAADSGQLLVEESFEGNGSAISGLAIAPDGLIIAACEDGLITALRINPLTLVWQKRISLASPQPLIADFDGNPGYEIALVSREGAFERFSPDGASLGSYQPPVVFTGITAPALGDIDLDGLPEILCAAREGAAALEFTGALTVNYPVAAARNESMPGSPIFAKKKDGSAAWLAFAGIDGLIHAFNQYGESQAGFPLSGDVPAGAALILEDLNGDGSLELAAAGRDGSLNLFVTGLPADDYVVWGREGSDERTFCLPGLSTSAPAGADLMPAKKVFCYPNPVVDGQTTIRFTLAQPAQTVTVRIFDLAGNYVGELSRRDLAPGDQEIVWDVHAIQSGVYIARVTAQAGKTSRSEIIKIAVTQ